MKSQHKKKKRERHEDETGEVSMTSGILGDNQILSDVSEGNPLSKNWPYYASVNLFPHHQPSANRSCQGAKLTFY
jgi:hypothetical protein